MKRPKPTADPTAKPANMPSAALTPPMTPEEFQRQCNVSRETMARLAIYGRMLEKWRGAINLVSKASLGDLWRRHMLDSAQLRKYIHPVGRDPARAPVILDLGSGAGFPGLVLAIMGAGEVHLVEAEQRKCTFLEAVARETATLVTVHARRIEELAPFTADVVTARALAPLDRLLAYALPFLGPEGEFLVLKGKMVNEEVTAAEKHWTMRVERFTSASDPTGVILRLRDIARDPAHGCS